MSAATRSRAIPVPDRMRHLPRNHVGYVVPWFVADMSNAEDPEPEWDFRVVRANGIVDALLGEFCFLCGNRLGRYTTFVIGPMCSINRVSAEPPNHRECAEYAVQVCPFLSTPKMIRRDNGLPESTSVAGHMIPRNPGVTLLWTTRAFTAFQAGDGLLFDVGIPESVTWWAEGRAATREEAVASITSGLPSLTRLAEEEGPGAVQHLEHLRVQAEALLP